MTDIGNRWLESSSDCIPEDRQGYLSTLNTLVPTLDSVLYQYVGEALSTYEQNSLFASAVMIGAASERAIYLLMKSLHRAVNDPKEKEAIWKIIEEERSLPKMFRRLQDNINRAKKLKLIPYSVHEGADRHLFSLQDAIRVQRNEAVHPEAGGQVKREAVHLSLSAFPNACKKIYDLMNWFNNNTLP